MEDKHAPVHTSWKNTTEKACLTKKASYRNPLMTDGKSSFVRCPIGVLLFPFLAVLFVNNVRTALSPHYWEAHDSVERDIFYTRARDDDDDVSAISSGNIAGAAAMLVGKEWMSDRGRKCYFNASMDALQKYWKPTHTSYPLILQKETWSPKEIDIISKRWPDLNPRFEELGSAFLVNPPPPVENITLPMNGKTWKTGYKRMCRFKTYGFLNAPYLKHFDYIMFIDDDSCFLEDIEFDVFQKMRETGAVYAFKQVFRDPPDVTVGLREFASNYMQDRRLVYANPELQAEVERNNRLFSFSTNLEWIDVRAYRRRELVDFFTFLDASGMIFHRRWGDAPLRFLLATMFWTSTQVMKVCVDYVHSTWKVSGKRTCNNTFVSDSVVKTIAAESCGLFCD